jgi:outer membrane protein assembly factor BamB
LWSFTTGGQILSSPAIGADGTVFFASLDGNLYALQPDGSERWRFHTGGVTDSSPVLDESGNLYLTVGACILSFDRNGKKRWDDCSPVTIDGAPAVAASGAVYCPLPWRRLVAFQNNRPELWNFSTDANITTSPVIDSSGTIYVCDGKFLYAINSANGLAPPAKSSWPMFRANARHTGRVQSVN